LRLGDTFVNNATRDVPPHLWMVLSDPHADRRVVLGNFSSDDGGHAGMPTAHVGEHPFLTHTSYFRCDKVRVADVSGVESVLTQRFARSNAPLSQALLERLQIGVLASPLVANEAKDILRRQRGEGDVA
jgi:hypothetical protein